MGCHTGVAGEDDEAVLFAGKAARLYSLELP